MTQEEFAELCGISRAYYGRIERGEHSVTLELCQRISEATGLSIVRISIKKRIIVVIFLIFATILSCACGNSGEKNSVQKIPTPSLVIPATTPSSEPSAGPASPTPTLPQTPVPTEIIPTITPTPMVLITKDPYDETVMEGGNVWFIAHADNANSISWIFTSAEGAATDSIESLIEQLPGLEIEILPEDTIALRNIPTAMNGWKIQAKFIGEGGAAVTQPATIYVNSYLGEYEPVLEVYRAFKDIPQENYIGYGGENTPYDINGVSILTRFNTNIGFNLQDINGDGIPELLLGLKDSDDEFYGNIVYDMFTLYDGIPHRVFISWERCRYYLTSSGYIYNTASGGAGWADHNLCSFDGKDLTIKEAVWSGNRNDWTPGTFYSDQGGSNQENFVAITEEDFISKIQEYEATIIPFDPVYSIYE